MSLCTTQAEASASEKLAVAATNNTAAVVADDARWFVLTVPTGGRIPLRAGMGKVGSYRCCQQYTSLKARVSLAEDRDRVSSRTVLIELL